MLLVEIMRNRQVQDVLEVGLTSLGNRLDLGFTGHRHGRDNRCIMDRI